jgi:P27 family predicted phage terminase small subunit
VHFQHKIDLLPKEKLSQEDDADKFAARWVFDQVGSDEEREFRILVVGVAIAWLLLFEPLGGDPSHEWDRIVGELTSLGVLSSFDRGPLAAYCNAYALWIEAMEMVQKHGAMIKSPKGFPIQSPYLSTVNRQAEIMLRIASEFGFTPASRSRIFSYSKSNSLLLDAEKESDDGLTKW